MATATKTTTKKLHPALKWTGLVLTGVATLVLAGYARIGADKLIAKARS